MGGVLFFAGDEPKPVLARNLGVAKRQWRLPSNDRNGVEKPRKLPQKCRKFRPPLQKCVRDL